MANRREMSGRRILGLLFLRSLLGLAVTIAVAYALDAAILRFRASTNRNAFSTVTVHPYYAMPRKDKKIEYMYDDPEEETCVNALFPHLGDSPCWYLRRHTDERLPDE
jgi:hypothetical protein